MYTVNTMRNNRVAVVGAGLAGLTAAYRILKEGKHIVDIYESQPDIGGRVQSRTIQGQKVDFGGFLMYPWYEHAHQLFSDLQIADILVSTPHSDIFYFLDDSGVALRENEIPFPVGDGLRIWTKSFFKILPKSDLAAPDLERFENKTTSEYLRSVLDTQGHAGLYETFFDTVNQGYCYGPVNQGKAAFMMPIVRQIQFHGDIRTTSFFPQGAETLTEHLKREIFSLGGNIHCNTLITGIGEKALTSESKTFDFDSVVFAQNVSHEIYQSLLPNIQIQCTYTRFIAVAVRLPKIPIVGNSQDWGAAFYVPTAQPSFQTLSIINLGALYGAALDGCVLMNIVLRDDETTTYTIADATRIAHAELHRLFADIHSVETLDFVHWKTTMPIAQEAFIHAVRDAHGKNGIYFAGDFLGAPSIETAIATGDMAAESVIAALD